jgi:uncharacterized membrane protein YeaQ/YmgE (transglycosylase-associated protein family)
MGAALLVWIVLGFIAGFVGNKLLNRRGESATLEIAIGIVGAIVGGLIFHRYEAPGATSLNVWNLIVPAGGAVILLTTWNVIRGSVSRA